MIIDHNELHPTDAQKLEAKMLRKELVPDARYERLSFRILEKEKGLSGYKIQDWLNIKYKYVRIDKGVISNINLKLQEIEAGRYSLSEINSKGRGAKINDFETALTGFRKTIDIIIEFLDLKDEEVLGICGKNMLPEGMWYAYFLVYQDDDKYLEDEDKEPSLGRGVLSIGSFQYKKQYCTVEFLVTQFEDNVSYYGLYKAHFDIEPGIVEFNLEADSKGRELHIKVFYDNKNEKQDIVVGQFTTFDRRRIQNGTILLHKTADIDTNKIKDVTGQYSYTRNPAEFNSIPPAIREFFALKSQNYHRVLKGIYDIDSLKLKIKKYTFYKDKNALFLEKVMPEMLVVTPISSVSADYDETFVNGILSDLQSKYENVLSIEANTENKNYGNKGNPVPIENLKQLQTKRFFVLILEHVDKMSYSFVQFGWALAFCKEVILVCKESSVSETILGFFKVKEHNPKEQLFTIITYNDTLAHAWETHLFNDLCEVINQHLPPSLLTKDNK